MRALGGLLGIVGFFIGASFYLNPDIIDKAGDSVILIIFIIFSPGILSVVPYLIFNYFAELEEERQTRYKMEEAEKEYEKNQQISYYNSMSSYCKNAIGTFESLPRRLSNAEKFLDQAEKDFAEGVFAPFWDSIENAAKSLGNFNEGIDNIKSTAYNYSQMKRKYNGTPPLFPLTVKAITKLKVSEETTRRFNGIVRTAQRNFQFASIYEQRKTNQILIAGFKTLAEALNNLSWVITDSIAGLTDSVARLDNTVSTMSLNLETSLDRIRSEAAERGSESAKREEKALEGLDNIQRGR